jgi:hypothetical protein
VSAMPALVHITMLIGLFGKSAADNVPTQKKAGHKKIVISKLRHCALLIVVPPFHFLFRIV